MAGKINFLGHPVHPMVIPFPLGLLTAAVVCDIIFLVNASVTASTISYWLIAAGVLSGLFAAIFGIADWAALDNGTRAKRLGGWHATVNVIMLVLFAISWFMRRGLPDHPSTFAVVLGIIAILFGTLGGWFGGEMVYRCSVGVDFDAHVNSPSSLSDKPAKANAR